MFRVKWCRWLIAVGHVVDVHHEGCGSSPCVVELPVGIGNPPFIPEAHVLRVGGATSRISDPLVGEAVNRDVHLRFRDVELSPWSVVDSGPHSAIVTDLPSISRQALDREGTKVTVVFSFFFICVNFISSTFVRLGEVHILRHSTVPDLVQGILCNVQGVPGLLGDVNGHIRRLDVLRGGSQEVCAMTNPQHVRVGPSWTGLPHDDHGRASPTKLGIASSRGISPVVAV